MPDPADRLDEGLPLEVAEGTAPAFATVRLVEIQRSVGTVDLRWHDELREGMACPQCQEHKLKRHKSTVYCGFCRQRWWSRPVR
jgi:ribosomal protein L37AE/L43A